MGLRHYLLLKTMKLLDRAVEERDKAFLQMERIEKLLREREEIEKQYVARIMEEDGVDETEARRLFEEWMAQFSAKRSDPKA